MDGPEQQLVDERLTYSIDETAQILGISRNSAFVAAHRGDFPTIRLGKRILVPRAALERLLDGEGKVTIRPQNSEAKGRPLDSNDSLLHKAMLLLASNPQTIFLGQNVAYDGNVMYKHFEGIPANQRLELPVCEELQMGMSIGLALQEFLPVSIYPRMDFLMLAMNQLVNHLDKLGMMSHGQYRPKVIIRTKIGSRYPLDAGPQHTQNHIVGLRAMLKTVRVVEIKEAEHILPLYQAAFARIDSTLIVENLDRG